MDWMDGQKPKINLDVSNRHGTKVTFFFLPPPCMQTWEKPAKLAKFPAKRCVLADLRGPECLILT